jgi:hypothetical protein
MVLLPGKAEFRAQDRDYYEATACPQHDSIKYKAQPAFIPLRWPRN